VSIRIGLIGAGRIGRRHLRGLAANPDVRIAAVCDTDRRLAEEAAAPFEASVHINFRSMLEAERLDAVFVCLPPFARGEPEILAARAGIHLLLTPPIGLNVEKTREVRKEIEKAGVVCAVACPWRHLDGLPKAREALADRKIALVRGWRFGPIPDDGWRSRRESSGGGFLQEATDLIDLAMDLAGEVANVSAAYSEGIAASRVAGCDVEDALAAVLRFRSGAVGTITTGQVATRHESVFVAIADGAEVRVTPEYVEIAETVRRVRFEQRTDAPIAAQEEFLAAVRTGEADRVSCTYASAMRVLEVCLGAVASAESRAIVNL